MWRHDVREQLTSKWQKSICSLRSPERSEVKLLHCFRILIDVSWGCIPIYFCSICWPACSTGMISSLKHTRASVRVLTVVGFLDAAWRQGFALQHKKNPMFEKEKIDIVGTATVFRTWENSRQMISCWLLGASLKAIRLTMAWS